MAVTPKQPHLVSIYNYNFKFQFTISMYNFSLQFQFTISIFNYHFQLQLQLQISISIFNSNFNFQFEFQFSIWIWIFNLNFNFQFNFQCSIFIFKIPGRSKLKPKNLRFFQCCTSPVYWQTPSRSPKSKSKSRLMTGFSLKSDFPTTQPATPSQPATRKSFKEAR